MLLRFRDDFRILCAHSLSVNRYYLGWIVYRWVLWTILCRWKSSWATHDAFCLAVCLVSNETWCRWMDTKEGKLTCKIPYFNSISRKWYSLAWAGRCIVPVADCADCIWCAAPLAFPAPLPPDIGPHDSCRCKQTNNYYYSLNIVTILFMQIFFFTSAKAGSHCKHSVSDAGAHTVTIETTLLLNRFP